ncbi:Histidine phosphatase family protein [Candidatus Bealeia paramacronuclearis]|uniref:Histidine phosphatase family protein n=1 Tax=Candidatus Bealeia paramacronuclearis TaxID=1921001 RepID=A0ABZ2C356_9PROT|nr:Histidine phosphatase family protein [Candidatus Bealeia paramacronuclearis]
MGSKIIYLLRHAEASPKNTGISDYDRSLTPHGEDQAQNVANYLRDKILTFDFVMCSSALRTQETLEPLRPYLGTEDIDLNPHYYNIEEEKVLDFLRLASEDAKRILYIGHNPGIAFAALRFVPQGQPHPYIQQGFPTAGLAGFSFEISSWHDLNWGKGQLIEFYNPDGKS